MWIAACVACAAYWYHAGDELGYPGWLGCLVSWGLFMGMYHVWPGGLLAALAPQIGLALLIGLVGTARLTLRK